jgi:hypothetical protein
MNSDLVFWGVTLIPLLGPLFYLCVRSPLISLPSDAVEQQPSIA